MEETTSTPAAPGRAASIAVVVPCYRVVDSISRVLAGIGPEVARIYCVDDACPDGSGDHVEREVADPRVVVLRNETNQGVGGATLAGFRRAREDGADVVVKLDGDGQMDPALIPRFVRPILEGRADYTKGNRFHEPASVRAMPLVRVVGNGVLSFLTKLSSGYWNVFDPTNGYIAIHASVLDDLALDGISRRYFFESDMLYHLNIVRAVVEDVPMRAVYGGETSHLSETRAGIEFPLKHARNFVRRVLFNYYLRDFSIGSIELVLGVLALAFGVTFGAVRWIGSSTSGLPVTAGTVMVAALPVIVGMQLVLSFFNEDTNSVPTVPLHRRTEG